MDFKTIWWSFAKETTIHGLHQAISLNHGSKRNRKLWLALFLLALSISLWKGYLYVQQYLTFNIKTASTFESGVNVTYPAITIWSETTSRRTVIGRHQLRMLVAVLNGMDSDGIAQLFYKINKTCYFEPNVPDEMDKILDSFNFATLTAATPDMITKTLDFVFINRKMIFVKCYRNEKEIDCKKLVLATLMDVTNTFSINLDLNIANYFLGSESGLGSLNKDYITTNNMETLFPTSNTKSFKFIMNANLDEYCAYNNFIWFGAGFSIKFHDSRTLPSLLFGTSVSLSPGYQFNIVLRPIRHIRNTEHLGKCLSSSSLYMFPESKDNLVELCVMQCENELVWQKCGCIITYLLPAGIAFARKHNIDERTISLGCVRENRSCVLDLAVLLNKQGEQKWCPQCKQPCSDTEYMYDVTTTKFPASTLVPLYKSDFNTTNEVSIGNSYLVLNIDFERSRTEIVIENQMFTLHDMFIYIGNIVILFLGMSFMTFGEILQLLLQSVHIVVMKVINICQNKFRRRTQVTVVKLQQHRQVIKVSTIQVQHGVPQRGHRTKKVNTTKF